MSLEIREFLKKAIDSIDTSKKVEIPYLGDFNGVGCVEDKVGLNCYRIREWYYLSLDEFRDFLFELVHNRRERKVFRHLYFRLRFFNYCWETHESMARRLSEVTDFSFSVRTIRFFLSKFKRLGLLGSGYKKVGGRMRYCYWFTPLGSLFGEFLDFIISKNLWIRLKKNNFIRLFYLFNKTTKYNFSLYIYSCLIMFRRVWRLKKVNKINGGKRFLRKEGDSGGDTEGDIRGVNVGLGRLGRLIERDLGKERFLLEVEGIIRNIMKNRGVGGG